MRISILFAFFILSTFVVSAQKGEQNLKKGLAVEGYDVVAYFDGKAQVGNKNIKSSFNGATYWFSTDANKQKFDDAPEDFVPQYGGWCAYAVAKDKGKVSVDPKTFEVRDGKLYLFYNKLFTNTLKLWLEEGPEELQGLADEKWPEIK